MTTKKKTTKKRAKKKTKKKVVKKRPLSKAEERSKELGLPIGADREFAHKPESTWPWPLRPYQQIAVDKFDSGIKRQMLIWHRRAGKDVFCLSLARREARRRVGGYVHFFPKHIQARRAIWQGIDPKRGEKFIDVAFGDYEADRNNTEMFIEMMNGSTWQLLGSDNYDRVVGSNAVGVVFSEWALCDPRAWDFIRPIILENDGFAIFITTFRGRNHAWQMTQALKNNPEWFVDIRDVTKTVDIEGNPILTEDDMRRERESGMSEALLQQEYYCNPEAQSDGAIYGKQVDNLRKESDRHSAVWNPNKPVYCVWNFDLPVFASCIHVQPTTPGTILAGETFEFVSLGEAIQKSEAKRWPVQRHVINGTYNLELIQALAELDRTPEVLHNFDRLTATTRTSSYLETCLINKAGCETLLDSLSGYVRRERFDAQVADLQYSDQVVTSWHSQMSEALETWAVWEYFGRDNSWSKAPDYTVQDRIAKTIL